MTEKIILNADEQIVCPKCAHEFVLGDGIARQTIDRHAEEFESLLSARRLELEERLAKEAHRKASELTAAEVARLRDQVTNAVKAEAQAKESVERVREEAIAKAYVDTEQMRKSLEEDLQRKNEEVKKFRVLEIELRRQRQDLETQQENLKLDIQRQLDEERAKISAAVSQREADRFAEKEAEWKKKIDDAQKSNDDLRRKLEQGSNQLHGEVLELEIEQSLTTTFFHDLIEEVKKGVHGADVIQTVRTPTGVAAGKIIWEAKNAENWSDRWLTKLKEDQQNARAEIAVLVTTVMPKGAAGPFYRDGDIWVVSPQVVVPMAETLRVILLELHRVRQVNVGKAEKMEQLYDYLASNAFSQRVRSVFDSFTTMQSDLDSEKRAMTKIWAKRQVQIDGVIKNMGTIVGELQGIGQSELAGLDSIESLNAIAQSAP